MPESLFEQSCRPGTLLKRRLWHKCFQVNFVKFLRTPFSQNIYGRLLLNYRSCRPEVTEKGVLKDLVKFAQKHLCPGLFVNTVAGWKPATSSNRDSGTGTFL